MGGGGQDLLWLGLFHFKGCSKGLDFCSKCVGGWEFLGGEQFKVR